LDVPSGPGYVFILIPKEGLMPTEFRNSESGCSGFIIPIMSLGEIVINENSVNTTYLIYKTFVTTSAQVDVWICD
jgi:hypothetical protein